MSDWIDKEWPMPKHALQEQSLAREVIEKFCAEVERRAADNAQITCNTELGLGPAMQQLLKEIRKP